MNKLKLLSLLLFLGSCSPNIKHVWIGKVHYIIFQPRISDGIAVVNYTHDSTEVEFEAAYGDKK